MALGTVLPAREPRKAYVRPTLRTVRVEPIGLLTQTCNVNEDCPSGYICVSRHCDPDE